MHQQIESPILSQAATLQCMAPSPTQAKLFLAFALKQLASVIKKGSTVGDCHAVYSVWAAAYIH